MSVLSILIFSFIFLHALSKEIIRQVAKVRLDGRFIMSMNFAIVYGLCPLAVFFFKDLYGDNVNIYGLNEDPQVVLEIAIAVLISYFTCIIFYGSGKRSRYFSHPKYQVGTIARTLNLRIVYGVMLALGAFSLYAYTYQYGGYFRTVELTGLIRQGLQDDYLETEGSFIFIQNLTTMAFLAAVIAMAFVAAEGRRYMPLLIAAAILSIMVSLIWGSRGQVLIFALMLIFTWMATRYPRGVGLRPGMVLFFVLLALMADFFVGVGKDITASLYQDDLTIGDVVSNYKYIPLAPVVGYYDEFIASLVGAFSYSGLDYSYYYDSFAIPLYLVPGRLFGIEKPETIVVLNTYLVHGVWEQMTPPGLVGYGYYSLGFPGVVISSGIYAFVLGLLDRAKEIRTFDKSVFPVIYAPFVLYWGIYYFQGDPKNLTLSMTPTVILILAFWFLSLSKRRPVRPASV